MARFVVDDFEMEFLLPLSQPVADLEFTVPGDGIKRDPDMDYIGCLGSNGQHSQILPFRVTFIVVTR